MRRLVPFVVLVLTACAGAEAPPPVQPQAPPPAPKAAPTEDPAAMAVAQMQAQQDQVARAKQAEFDGIMAQAKRDADAAKKAEQDAEAARRKACDDSRPARVSHAKEMVIARMDAESHLLTSAPAIRKSCRLTEHRTGAFNVSRGVGGVRVAPEVAVGVECGRLPKGVTKQDAWVVLARESQGGSVKPFGPILESEDESPEDDQCRGYDRKVGIDFRSVTFDDLATVDRLRAWTPPAP